MPPMKLMRQAIQHVVFDGSVNTRSCIWGRRRRQIQHVVLTLLSNTRSCILGRRRPQIQYVVFYGSLGYSPLGFDWKSGLTLLGVFVCCGDWWCLSGWWWLPLAMIEDDWGWPVHGGGGISEWKYNILYLELLQIQNLVFNPSLLVWPWSGLGWIAGQVNTNSTPTKSVQHISTCRPGT